MVNAMEENFQNNELIKDFLQEVGNIGTGNAITALSQFLNASFQLELSTVHFMHYQQVYHFLGKVDALHVGVFVEARGEISGLFLFLIDQLLTEKIIQTLLGEDADFNNLNELEESLLCEMGNIVCNAYATAMNGLLNKSIQCLVPQLCVDMAGAILNVPISHFAFNTDDILMIETIFKLGEEKYKSHILFLPDYDFIQNIPRFLE